MRTASTYSADLPSTSETASAVALPGRSALNRSRDRTLAAASVLAVPGVGRHIDIGAGEDESGYDVGVPPGCGVDERSIPAEKVGCRLGQRTAVALGYIGSYPLFSLRSRPAPAAMSCSTTSA